MTLNPFLAKEENKIALLSPEDYGILKSIDLLMEPLRILGKTTVVTFAARSHFGRVSSTGIAVLQWQKSPAELYEAWDNLCQTIEQILAPEAYAIARKEYREKLSEAKIALEVIKHRISSRRRHELLISSHMMELIRAVFSLPIKHALNIGIFDFTKAMANKGLSRGLVIELLEARNELKRNFSRANLELYTAVIGKIIDLLPDNDFSAVNSAGDELWLELQWTSSSSEVATSS